MATVQRAMSVPRGSSASIPPRQESTRVHEHSRPRGECSDGSGRKEDARSESERAASARPAWGSEGPVATLVNELIDSLRPTKQSERRRRAVFRHVAQLVSDCFSGENVLVRGACRQLGGRASWHAGGFFAWGTLLRSRPPRGWDVVVVAWIPSCIPHRACVCGKESLVDPSARVIVVLRSFV